MNGWNEKQLTDVGFTNAHLHVDNTRPWARDLMDRGFRLPQTLTEQERLDFDAEIKRRQARARINRKALLKNTGSAQEGGGRK